MHVVAFDECQQDNSQKLEGHAAALKNCRTQFSTYIKKMEIIVKSYTVIEESDVKFMIDNMNTVGSTLISLSEVKDKNEFDQITARVKVTKVGESDVVGGGKRKQEITVDDTSENAKVTLWEGDIGKLVLGSCYRFVVQASMGRKHLSWPPNGGPVYVIDHIGNVVHDTVGDEKIETLVAANVIGVHEVDTYYVCIFCKKGNVDAKEGVCR